MNNYENSLNVEISRKYGYDSQQKILLNVNRSLSKGQDAIDIMLQREYDNIHVCGYCLEVNEKLATAHHVLFHLKLSLIEKNCLKMYDHLIQKKHL